MNSQTLTFEAWRRLTVFNSSSSSCTRTQAFTAANTCTQGDLPHRTQQRLTRRRHRHRIASSGSRIAPPWPCRMACLQRLAGTDPVSLRSWSVQQAWKRPGRRLQSPPSERPDARPTWQCRALCAGVPWVSQAMWPNTDKRRLLMKSITGGKPVWADTSAFVTCWDQCMCRIWHWHSSNIFSFYESNVQVSAANNKMDITRAWYRRILVLSWRILSRQNNILEVKINYENCYSTAFYRKICLCSCSNNSVKTLKDNSSF